MARQSPLDLKWYGISSFSFSYAQDEEMKSDAEEPKLDVQVTRNHKTKTDDKHFHLIEMDISVEVKRKDVQLVNVALKINGIFDARPKNSKPDEEEEKKLLSIVSINGSSILYGIAREYISMATCHCPGGCFILPSVSFMPSPKKKGKQKGKSEPVTPE